MVVKGRNDKMISNSKRIIEPIFAFLALFVPYGAISRATWFAIVGPFWLLQTGPSFDSLYFSTSPLSVNYGFATVLVTFRMVFIVGLWRYYKNETNLTWLAIFAVIAESVPLISIAIWYLTLQPASLGIPIPLPFMIIFGVLILMLFPRRRDMEVHDNSGTM